MAYSPHSPRAPWSRDQRLTALLLGIATVLVLLALLSPLLAMLARSLQGPDQQWVGLANFSHYLSTPSLFTSVTNTLWLGGVITLLVGLLAFGYAFALNRTAMPGKPLFKAIGMLPILAPSLLPAISLVYLFGNQGVAKGLLQGIPLYGPAGLIMGLAFWCFPHAMLLINTGLSTADARLYEAARSLKASPLRTFFTVTLPGARYGLLSALIVVFTLVVCDFGVPKVVGGQFNVLATDIYKQVVGQQNFSMGAVTSIMLLLPALLAFTVDRYVQRKQQQLFDSRSVPYQPRPGRVRDTLALLYCSVIALIILTVIGMAIYASLISFWPYNKALTFSNYQFASHSTYGWAPFFNSVVMATLVAVIGSLVTFIFSYIVERSRGFRLLRGLLHLLAMLPIAVPGMVLGLGYIFFFNHPANPLGILYGTMTILVVNSLTHLFTVGHLTAVTSLRQLPHEVEAVAASLKVPQYKVFLRVALPVSLPALLDIATYLFVNAMTTTSAVIFLYSPDTVVASVAVVNMEDAGNTAPAAAMAVMIMLTAALATLLHRLLSRSVLRRTQRWRHHQH